MFRKTITTLAIAAASVTGVVAATPAQAADRCSPTSSYGERICVTSVDYNRAGDTSAIHFTLTGPWTDYRVTANDTSELYYPGSRVIGVNGHPYTQVCATESTTHWRGCA
ncbi:hypothetical protein [Embleya sp. AB8]|uniref:hypothetical protein n=1 Tax=Embleya sp. AB8 TaxID=3156304 RepID=UPI003C713114